MAPSRGKGKAAITQRSTRSRTTSTKEVPDVPDVYQCMLVEAHIRDEHDSLVRPRKKRRVVARPSASQKALPANKQPAPQADSPTVRNTNSIPGKAPQTVEASPESEGSEFDFEDVDLDAPAMPSGGSADEVEDLSISLQTESTPKRAAQERRKPASVTEKAHRLVVHKLHVLCLLAHCMYINGRCNNARVQLRLTTLLAGKTRAWLNPSMNESQFQRNRSFIEGLQHAVDSFYPKFQLTAAGLQKPQWDLDGTTFSADDRGVPTDKSDFIDAAKSLEGSQDLGNQLFCALLRSVGVQARIVCSLQPLPFSSMPKQVTPRKPQKERVFAIASDRDLTLSELSGEDSSVKGSASVGKVPSVRRRLGQPSFAATTPQTPSSKSIKHAPARLAYPVFWVEAFNTAHQKWVPVDPMVTHSVNKPAKLEPPLTYEKNQMTYVIAFEEDGVARDVTKRYTKAYNAKTRRHRVEATGEDGSEWWKKTMRLFRRRHGALDRDQVEDAELAQKEAREGLPANVQDFKDHPYYALERHLKRHEVLHPRREAGKVNAGTAAKPRMEAIFRRQDVLSCKSADKWYRSGRIIKESEQPLKQVPARTRRNASPVDADEAETSSATTGLYAESQTDVYVPPPVQRGRIPKNAFGNLDIYVPSMVPAGGVHIRHALAQRAAKLLRVDYADAVIGFKFQGRHGTAVVDGVVVAQAFGDAVSAVINGIEDEIVEDESRARSLEALRLWKRFLTGLRIAERVKAYGEGSAEEQLQAQQVQMDEAMDEPELAGGFVLNEAEETTLPTAGRFSVHDQYMPGKKGKQRARVEDSEDDSLVLDDDADNEPARSREANIHSSMDDEGGGFFLDADMTDDELAGGFMPPNAVPDTLDHGGGGGFFVAENDPIDDPESGLLERKADEPIGSRFDLAGQDEPDATRSVENLSHVSESHAGIPASATAVPDASGLDVSAKGTISEENPVEVKMVLEEQDESDKGSLLSHDPEDDDAEPDWLESD